MDSPTILVIGSANVDLVTRVPRCPKPGESLIGTAFSTVAGGKGANQAVAAARLGAHTYFAGCVGDDAFGAMQRKTLAADGIDLTHLKTHPDKPTGTAVILVADQGQNSIVVTPSANSGITPDDVAALEPLFSGLDAVLLQLEIPLDTVEAALDLARRTGVLSILDAGPAQQVPESIIAKAGLVSPNETEAEAMTGISVKSVDDAHKAASRLLDAGAAEVVIKLGANGALYAGRESLYLPAFSVNPVDTVAAGDAFTAALGVCWSRMPRKEALQFANAAGALATTVPGAQPSMPARAAVEAFLNEQG
ncbi:MAG: ribokinase [Candidatus Hydrogenedentes bacterium]|nr:ribokinase [Candidatus Hydrogenedentota bacterium]